MTNLEKLRNLLEELFQLDQADLDFGIYRIMNTKRDEVVRFLDKDLLPQVNAAFAKYQSADKVEIKKELDKAVEQAQALGADPQTLPKVRELQEKYATSAVDVTALENEVFSHLFNFFRRYYSEGDFISLRRYKEGVYAIPYEGEEVKLHWANADQYYVKSSETFRDYSFQCSVFSVQKDGTTAKQQRRVSFKLVAASTEQDNNKAVQGKERRFVLREENPVVEENGELIIRFEYKSHDGKEKQDALNAAAVARILSLLKTEPLKTENWLDSLAAFAPTEKDKTRSLLAKHLSSYTARNTFDYFIHKDLGRFLRRELDFYIKNEVMHLDDIEHESVPKVEQYLSQIKVIRSIAHKIIQFFEQLENFQKKLWLKKKFVIETNYCITLDRVPEELYPEIAKNDAQREEWVRLFAIDEIKKDLNGPGYSKPLKIEFLKTHRHLILDTSFFPPVFTTRLLGSVTNLDASLDGLLIHGCHFHALSLLEPKFRDRIDCLYLDPPFNTNEAGFIYKNEYQHSSWCSMMAGVLSKGKQLLSENGVIATAIDDLELHRLGLVCDLVFGIDKRLGILVVEIKPSGRTNDKFLATSHEYYLFYALDPDKVDISFFELSEAQKGEYDETDTEGAHKWRDFLRTGGYSTPEERPNSFYPIYFNEKTASISLEKHDGSQELLPIDSEGRKRVWRKTPPSFQEHLDKGEIQIVSKRGGGFKVEIIDRIKTGIRPKSVWTGKKYDAASHGTKLLKKLFGEAGTFTFPKALFATEDVIHVVTGQSDDAVVLDFFGGSGTTGHAVVELNRRDETNRRFVLVEMGEYFSSVLLPRMKKVHYASEWRDGKPTSHTDGLSCCFKYIRLESYEDALNNLELKQTDKQGTFLDADAEMREQYILSYMLDVESRGSQSLLNVEAFRNPDEYKLRVERNGETQLVNVDLVETFNWLLGLTVKHIDVIRGVRVVEGTAPNGDRVLVLWRNIDKLDNDALDKWFQKQDYNTREMVYDVFYVNGDNNLENLRRPDQTWKVRLIEEEFQRLMFDVQDV